MACEHAYEIHTCSPDCGEYECAKCGHQIDLILVRPTPPGSGQPHDASKCVTTPIEGECEHV